MKRTRRFLFLLTVVLVSGTSGAPEPSRVYCSDFENVLGTSFQLKVTTRQERIAARAEEVALAEIDRLASLLSAYDATSEFSRWQKTTDVAVPLSKELFEVLSDFEQWHKMSHGALSASAAAASAIWKRAEQTQHLPESEELAQAVSAMNQLHWILNAPNHTATHLSSTPLVLNTFVKSYIIAKAIGKVMELPGVEDAVLNIGGDMVASGENRETISIANPMADAENDQPLDVISVRNKAVATSGNYRRGFRIGEAWYSHIIDVRTALPASEIISATVIADRAEDAGALATAMNILTPEESEVLASQIPGVEYMLVTREQKIIRSEGWKKWQVLTVPLQSAVANEISGVRDFEVVVSLELARFEGRFRRPYVAVWIENEKRETVRTLALWYSKPRWLPDLRKWYSKNGRPGGSGTTASISSATRSPGQYSLKWDGKDEQGNSLPDGKYTIYIEAAREHGTYQLLHEEIKCKGKPLKVDLPGGTEISSASIDYHLVETH